jgi:hypothetical protein
MGAGPARFCDRLGECESRNASRAVSYRSTARPLTVSVTNTPHGPMLSSVMQRPTSWRRNSDLPCDDDQREPGEGPQVDEPAEQQGGREHAGARKESGLAGRATGALSTHAEAAPASEGSS